MTFWKNGATVMEIEMNVRGELIYDGSVKITKGIPVMKSKQCRKIDVIWLNDDTS